MKRPCRLPPDETAYHVATGWPDMVWARPVAGSPGTRGLLWPHIQPVSSAVAALKQCGAAADAAMWRIVAEILFDPAAEGARKPSYPGFPPYSTMVRHGRDNVEFIDSSAEKLWPAGHEYRSIRVHCLDRRAEPRHVRM